MRFTETPLSFSQLHGFPAPQTDLHIDFIGVRARQPCDRQSVNGVCCQVPAGKCFSPSLYPWEQDKQVMAGWKTQPYTYLTKVKGSFTTPGLERKMWAVVSFCYTRKILVYAGVLRMTTFREESVFSFHHNLLAGSDVADGCGGGQAQAAGWRRPPIPWWRTSIFRVCFTVRCCLSASYKLRALPVLSLCRCSHFLHIWGRLRPLCSASWSFLYKLNVDRWAVVCFS